MRLGRSAFSKKKSIMEKTHKFEVLLYLYRSTMQASHNIMHILYNYQWIHFGNMYGKVDHFSIFMMELSTTQH